MSGQSSTKLEVSTRASDGSRAARRLRREGLVPGVIYGAGEQPTSFAIDARLLRNTLAHAHAVLDVSVDGKRPTPAIVKEIHRHPVREEALHVDLLRVRLDETIHAAVTIELTGADKAPGVVAGGVLSQEVHQLDIEALPGDIPDSISHDVSGLELNATVTLASLVAPSGVKFLDDLEATVIATITPPSAEPVEESVETETEVIGQGKPAGETADETSPDDSAN